MLLTISAVLSIVLNILLIPLMGILGAAVASLVTYGSLFIITLIVTRRYLKFEMNLPFMLKSIFSSIIMAICIWLISPESIAWIIASIFIGIVAYFVVLLLIRGLSKEERTFFVNFLKDNLKLRKPRVIG
jgi:O-antigen/teichoic acid export membrane protein